MSSARIPEQGSLRLFWPPGATADHLPCVQSCENRQQKGQFVTLAYGAAEYPFQEIPVYCLRVLPHFV
jgi:hypothetical protein